MSEQLEGWRRQKPTEPGIYQVRGFELCQPRRRQTIATVVVAAASTNRRDKGALVHNLHISTSEGDLGEWGLLAHLSDGFEWRGPFVLAAPTATTHPPRLVTINGRTFAVPARFRFVAQDANGSVWAYAERPLCSPKLSHRYVGVGAMERLGKVADATNWETSLIDLQA